MPRPCSARQAEEPGYDDEGPQQPQDGEDPRQELPCRSPARPGLCHQQEEPPHEGAPGLTRRGASRGRTLAFLLIAGSSVASGLCPAFADIPPAAKQDARLDALYARLAQAHDRAQAAAIEAEILRAWQLPISPTTSVLVEAGHAAISTDDTRHALDDLDSAIDLQPEIGSLWRERAIARVHAHDAAGAVTDLGHAIDLDPRDFLAWETLSRVLEVKGDARGAYAAWQKALALDPQADDAKARLDLLRRKALGERA